MSLPPVELKPADFASDQEVKWCPGCGDYAVLAQTKRVLAKLGIERHKVAFISGIGCSSRFPYYVNTYGMHSIHGRAPTIASGLKVSRPDLHVWVTTGDGDGLSIGGNHLIHILRRNIDVKIILFNNRIYGLTKGQYSPTTEQGKKTKSSPAGVPEMPIRPVTIALAAEASFVARALDADVKHLEYVLERAARHRGAAFIEVYQNCVIFNDGAYSWATDKTLRANNTVYLEHGKPLIFGENRDRGIRLNNTVPEVVDLKTVRPDDLLHHDETLPEITLAMALGCMTYPRYPEAFGVFRAVERPTYEQVVAKQIEQAIRTQGEGDLQSLLRGPDTWTVS